MIWKFNKEHKNNFFKHLISCSAILYSVFVIGLLGIKPQNGLSSLVILILIKRTGLVTIFADEPLELDDFRYFEKPCGDIVLDI